MSERIEDGMTVFEYEDQEIGRAYPAFLPIQRGFSRVKIEGVLYGVRQVTHEWEEGQLPGASSWTTYVELQMVRQRP